MTHRQLHRRRWRNFCQNRRAFWSLWIFVIAFGVSLFAELIANDRPILVKYRDDFYSPIVKFYPEQTFGGDLRTEAIYADIEVECLPGATAFVPALVNSGLPNDRFVFEGFLPIKKGRQTKLQELAEETRTMVFYESPHKLLKTLAQFVDYFGADRPISVSRELTKLYEETVRGTLSGGWLRRLREKASRWQDKVRVRLLHLLW